MGIYKFNIRNFRPTMLIGNPRDSLVQLLSEVAGIPHPCPKSSVCILNESNLNGGENIGGSTAAPAAPEAASDDDDGGDPDPEPERRPRTRKTRNTSTAGNLPAPTAAHIPDALTQFDSRPASSFVRLPVVCGLYACSPATAWRWVKAGKIPAPIKLSDRVTAWRVGDLRAALSQLAA